MDMEMIVVDEQLPQEVVTFIDKHFTGKDPRSVINEAVESYKLFEAGMGEIDKFRSEYDKMGWVGKFTKFRNLAEDENVPGN